jgi:hypothetical protein
MSRRPSPFPAVVTREEQAALLRRIRDARRLFRQRAGFRAPRPFYRDEHLPALLRPQAE